MCFNSCISAYAKDLEEFLTQDEEEDDVQDDEEKCLGLFYESFGKTKIPAREVNGFIVNKKLMIVRRKSTVKFKSVQTLIKK